MKIIYTLLLFFAITSCSQYKGIRIFNEKEYWSNEETDENPILKLHSKGYTTFSDVFMHFKMYYENGILKSHVIMRNDLLESILEVNDMEGNPLYFGDFNNGNGWAIEYNLWTGTKENEGYYINGNREGWWKTFHFKSGEVMDSTFYIEGYRQSKSDTLEDGSIEWMLDFIGGDLKNNLYR